MGVPQAVQIRHPSGFGPQVGSTWRPGALRRLTCAGFGPPEGRFSTPRGAIFTFFQSSRVLHQSCPVRNAYASIRPVQLDVLA